MVTVGVDEIISRTGISEERVNAVIDRFRINLDSTTPAQVIDDFTRGDNPLRVRPLVVSDSGRVMLPHSTLTMGAVKENLELHLKTSTVWQVYAAHRGHVLETRTRAALEKVFPGAVYRDGFEYYVPGTPQEEGARDPAKYTKRVEGDHLIILDDVAIIVEDKAVALSALSRGGKANRIRTDLTGIVTKAAEQAGRLQDLIERDQGVRIEGEGWVDLSRIREVHTIAVSLDDLLSITTATAELVRAGLLNPANICWTVSLHDLELITELIGRPAEFLLYLRRRRNPLVTVMFTAPDELDLFLYYFEAGLWVEPDPDQVRVAFPFLPEPSTGDRRRYQRQVPTYLTSRTDALDQWYYSRGTGNPSVAHAPKPKMVASPLAPLIDELGDQRFYGWLSIGATLLEGSTAVQQKMARAAARLLREPAGNGNGRSLTVPITSTTVASEGWLLVWATRPTGRNADSCEKDLREYLMAKKHQLSLVRGAVFLYDEGTRQLAAVYYDGHTGPLPAGLEAKLSSLLPTTALQRWAEVSPRRRPSKARSKRARKRR